MRPSKSQTQQRLLCTVGSAGRAWLESMSQRGIHKSREVLRIQIGELVGDLEPLGMATLKRTPLCGVAGGIALAVVRGLLPPPPDPCAANGWCCATLQLEAKKEPTTEA